MANESEQLKQLKRTQKEASEEEQKRINMNLRGGKNVDEQEDERGVLGASAEQSGRYRGEMARNAGTREELDPNESNKEERRSSHHGS